MKPNFLLGMNTRQEAEAEAEARMQKSFSAHTQFFSSLKHLEKRLKLENNEASAPVKPSKTREQTDSLGSPIYICSHIQEEEEEEEDSQGFVSGSPPTPTNDGEAEDRFNVDMLMQLLRLSDDDDDDDEVGSGCDDEFYDRIVGVKGPKNIERLDRWIKHFSTNKEPFRLAHLMLGKAAFLHSDDGFVIVFPSTIHDFLHSDPTTTH